MGKNIAVLGTGAIGSCIGGLLSKAGHNVVLIDQWPEHVNAMRTRGLHIAMPEGDVHIPVRAAHLCDVSSFREGFDVVFLVAKSYDTAWLVELIKPHLKADGVLVSAQNSLDDERIAPIIGYGRDLACVVMLSAEVFDPGHIKRNSPLTQRTFLLGELHGRVTPRVRELAEMLSVVGKTEVSQNIWGAKWTKLVVCTKMAVGPVTGVSSWDATDKPELLDLCVRLGIEAVQVGKSLGYALEPLVNGVTADDLLGSSPEEAIRKAAVTFSRAYGNKTSHNTIEQDLLKRRRTEVDHINGLVASKGRKAGIATPLNSKITDLVKRIERDELKPGLANLELLLRGNSCNN